MINKVYTYIKNFIKENFWFLISLIAIIVIFNIRLPWSINAPGGLINVDERLSNVKYKNKGDVNLTYVSFIPGTIPTILLSYVLPNWDLIKNSDIKYDNEELIDANRRDVIYLYESVSSATYVAYQKANKELEIIDKSYYVVYKTEEAKSDIKVGDKILEYEGNKFEGVSRFGEFVKTKKAGDLVKFKVLRDGEEKEVKVKLYEEEGNLYAGMVIDTINTYDKNTINYTFQSSESGSSGGLMLSIAMYNALVKEDITKGKKVCGTGTIDYDGNVGEIGGVKYKLLGAIKNRCDIFIVPSENYKEALKVKKKKKSNIKLIEAKTFDQVLEEIK